MACSFNIFDSTMSGSDFTDDVLLVQLRFFLSNTCERVAYLCIKREKFNEMYKDKNF